MKKLFDAIRKGDTGTVRALIAAKPELVSCVAGKTPAKDAGQSPLQVALKAGAFDIANLLLDAGADLNYVEDSSCGSAWRAPVLHDAINAAVMSSRWNVNSDAMGGFRVCSTPERADAARNVLRRMLAAGADVNACDSHGNSGLWRFCLQAAQILPRYDWREHRETDDRIFTRELHDDLLAVLDLLWDAGADPAYAAPHFGVSPLEYYREGSLALLLREVFA